MIHKSSHESCENTRIIIEIDIFDLIIFEMVFSLTVCQFIKLILN